MLRNANAGRRAAALALAAAGLTLCVPATLVVASMGDGASASSRSSADSQPTPYAVSAPGPITIMSPGDVSVVQQVYGPGQASGWHLHSGLHAVAVLSGDLTVIDGECRSQRIGPGDSYVGGQELHLARNQTAEPVHMVVTYINSPGQASTTAAVAPIGCEAS